MWLDNLVWFKIYFLVLWIFNEICFDLKIDLHDMLYWIIPSNYWIIIDEIQD